MTMCIPIATSLHARPPPEGWNIIIRKETYGPTLFGSSGKEKKKLFKIPVL